MNVVNVVKKMLEITQLKTREAKYNSCPAHTIFATKESDKQFYAVKKIFTKGAMKPHYSCPAKIIYYSHNNLIQWITSEPGSNINISLWLLSIACYLASPKSSMLW